MSLKIDNLQACFLGAKLLGAKYIGVKISMSTLDEPEVIINPIENAEKKLEYYKNAYTEDLRLKAAPEDIFISGFTYGNDFNEIGADLI